MAVESTVTGRFDTGAGTATATETEKVTIGEAYCTLIVRWFGNRLPQRGPIPTFPLVSFCDGYIKRAVELHGVKDPTGKYQGWVESEGIVDGEQERVLPCLLQSLTRPP